MGYFTRRLALLRFEDAVGLGMTIGPGEGNLTIGFMNAHNAEVQNVNDRDAHDGFTLGADLIQTCTITVNQRDEVLLSALQARITDFLSRAVGSTFAPTLTTSVDDTAWAWVAKYALSGASSAQITLPKCKGGFTFAEGQPSNTFAIQFENYRAPVRA